MTRKNRKRLSIDIPIKVHNELMKVVKNRNITLTHYTLRALLVYALYHERYEEHAKVFKEFL